MCALPLEREIEYPTSDGQPMAETTLHRKVMSSLIGGLERRYAATADVWVGGNLLLYYVEGNPAKSVSPDVMLARGVKGKHDRDLWLLWEEGVPPALVFEITSRSTRREDTGRKKDLYEKLGVSELILFDPYGEYLKPRLQGFRLDRDGRYHPTPLYPDGSLDLKTTGLMVRPEGEHLRLVDPATGEKLLWEDELEEARRRDQAARRAAEERAAREAAARAKAEERAAQEAAARAAAEEQVRALTEELARLRAQSSKPS
jgi:Uma2 family endonuclease